MKNILFCIFLILIEIFVFNFIPPIGFAVISAFVIPILCASIFHESLIIRKFKEKIEVDKKSYSCLSNSYDGIREFKHDFSNIMQSIGGYILTDDMVGLKSYYSNIFKDCKEINALSSFNQIALNSPAIFSLIADKYEKSKSLGIDFNVDILIDLNSINMNIYELSRILGIFIDNSIEASKECDEKFINIIISKNSINHFYFITIENSFNNSVPIDTQKIFDKNFSTKPKNSGLGLWKVKKIVKKYEHINLNTEIRDNVFIQNLFIFY